MPKIANNHLSKSVNRKPLPFQACFRVFHVQLAALPRLWSAFLAANVIQEAEIQFLHTEDMSNGLISLGDNDDYGLISRGSSPCISTKSLPLDESRYPSAGSTPCSTDSPHTSSHAPSNQNTLNDLSRRMRS